MAKFSTKEKVPCEFPAGLRILAVDYDPANLQIIQQMCFQFHYQVMTFSTSLLALNYVWAKKGGIDLILIETHMPYMDGYEFLQQVTEENSVPVILMSLDNSISAVTKAVMNGACDYWTKPLHENQFKIMWKHVLKKFWSENELPKTNDSEFASFAINASYSKESGFDEPHGCNASPSKKPKKTRLVWSKDLHQQFVRAMIQIGFDKATPKGILEEMKMPDLTVSHIASHLQKYRRELQLKKSEASAKQLRIQEN